MNCRAGCPTGGHKTWGECARAANFKVAYCQDWKGADATRQKKWDKDLEAYRSAVSQGMQPETTQRRDVDKAVVKSNETGEAFKAF